MHIKKHFNCDSTFREIVSKNLESFQLQSAASDGASSASVAVTIVDSGMGSALSGMPEHQTWQKSASLILTRRSSRLKNHPGQWAFPGGRIEDGESPEDAASREMEEEIGLILESKSILGRLDDFVTRSGFHITPVVFWGGETSEFFPNPDEVDSVHRIPVIELLREDAPILDKGDGPDPVLKMPVGDDWIAAPTAAILYQFREVCLLGKDTRVAHFDQPKFAWS
ncbi:MAG: CoA pyrophosphatase [Gammaproteobacteria bacterium]|nr:CoA pyrophosphatase [Gammaproteobacteria bacterium]